MVGSVMLPVITVMMIMSVTRRKVLMVWFGVMTSLKWRSLKNSVYTYGKPSWDHGPVYRDSGTVYGVVSNPPPEPGVVGYDYDNGVS